MNSENKTNTVKKLLDSSFAQLNPVTLEKLRTARKHALDHQRTHTSPVLAWVYAHVGFGHAFHFSKSTSWAIAIIFIACLFSGASYWQNYAKEHEACETDIAILIDDLPLHVYVD